MSAQYIYCIVSQQQHRQQQRMQQRYRAKLGVNPLDAPPSRSLCVEQHAKHFDSFANC